MHVVQHTLYKKYMIYEHISDKMCSYRPHSLPLIIIHRMFLIIQIRALEQE